MSFGPFLPDLEPGERKAQVRSLRALVRVLTGPRGKDAATALLAAEIAPDAETLSEAERTFDGLAPVNRRRVLASFAAVLPPSCSAAVVSGRSSG